MTSESEVQAGRGSIRPGRRAVVRAAAWTVPAVSLVAAAPAYAVTACTTPTETFALPSYAAANWTISTVASSGTAAGITVLQPGNTPPRVFTNVEPNNGNAITTVTVTTTAEFVFTAGNIYYFTIPHTYSSLSNALPIKATIKVGATALLPAPFADSTDKVGPPENVNQLSETALAVFTPAADTTATISLVFVVDNSASTTKQLGDDLGVHQITVSSCPAAV